MPSKLREWFDNVGHLDHLDKEDETLKRAFAMVIYHVIKGDDIETVKEKKKFATFFKNDFDLNDQQVDQLHEEASQFDGDFEIYLGVLKEKISVYPEIKLKLMQILNSILTTQKFDIDEYEAFEEVKEALSK